jgi:hypothetical protein
MTRFTHITLDGQPVIMINEQHQNTERGWTALVQARSSARFSWPLAELAEMDSPEGERILEDLGLRTERAGQEDDTNRVALARWAQCLDASRSTLADAIREVLAYGETGHRAVTRLQKAQADALEDLAFFKP